MSSLPLLLLELSLEPVAFTIQLASMLSSIFVAEVFFGSIGFMGLGFAGCFPSATRLQPM